MEPIEPRVQWVLLDLSTGIKRPRREAGRSRSGAEVKSTWSDTATPSHVFMAYCVIEHRNSVASTDVFVVLCVAGSKDTGSTSKWHR